MKKNIDRREFFKTAGTAAIVMGGLGAAAGCASKGGKKDLATSSANQTDGAEGMTYRINNGNGDKVSILGYGCMRWPMTKEDRARRPPESP